jgi:hypothetical protein
MQMVAHGGHCCGIRTIFGFGVFNQTNFNQFFRVFSDFRDGIQDWTSSVYRPALNENGQHMVDHMGRALLFYGGTPGNFQGVEIRDHDRRFYNNRLIEIVLTDGQLMNTGVNVLVNNQGCGSWLQALSALGFRPVSRFRNSNSGRYCTVFHFVANLENDWEEAAPVIRPTVVFTYYRKVYASGNVGLTMYPTIFEAFNGHRGRDPRVNRYEVLSDASVRVTERLTPDAE